MTFLDAVSPVAFVGVAIFTFLAWFILQTLLKSLILKLAKFKSFRQAFKPVVIGNFLGLGFWVLIPAGNNLHLNWPLLVAILYSGSVLCDLAVYSMYRGQISIRQTLFLAVVVNIAGAVSAIFLLGRFF